MSDFWHDMVYLAAVMTTIVNVLIWLANRNLDENKNETNDTKKNND